MKSTGSSDGGTLRRTTAVFPQREPDTSQKRLDEIRARHEYWRGNLPYKEGFEAIEDLLAMLDEARERAGGCSR